MDVRYIWVLGASFSELYLELAWPTLTIFTAMVMRMRYELARTYRYIHTNIQTYISTVIF